jgi:hypothetical protein
METTTNTTGEARHFSLSEMSDVLMRRDRPAVGFFVSQKLWDALAARWHHEGNGKLEPIPHTFHGIKIAIDPGMPDTEFDVATTGEAWQERLRALGQALPDPTETQQQ